MNETLIHSEDPNSDFIAVPDIDEMLDALDVNPSFTRKGKIAVSTLNQWALDFDGNRDRIIESIRQAREEGATYRLGPELEVPGYSCEDHFLEDDTTRHSYEVLAQILASGVTNEILCAIGIPVVHEGVRYNCDAYVLNGEIIGFRPKRDMANDGNYREQRWFTAWKKDKTVEDFMLPEILQKVTGQRTAPIGDFLVEANDTVLGSEKCEEMFTPRNSAIDQNLDGSELTGNGSGSHWQIRKLDKRVDLIKNSTGKSGGIYAYANLSGGDGGRLLFDGSSMIAQNGQLLAQAEQFSLKEIQTTTAVVDFAAVQSERGNVRSLGVQADETESFPRVQANINLTSDDLNLHPTDPITPGFHTPSEEIAKGPAVWLWDYLRRSGASGFFLPLSGGKDSAATATIVYSMCDMVVKEVKAGNKQVLSEIQRIMGDTVYVPNDPKLLTKKLLHTCYMPNEGTSSSETEDLAAELARQLGANHMTAGISKIVEAFRDTAIEALGIVPRFEADGGHRIEDLALQNIQARSRMALSYLLAQLIPRKNPSKGGFMLVLGSANVDEANRGYFTKYDCSSADINPIGGINKADLRDFLEWAMGEFSIPALLDIIESAPSAELQPLEEGGIAQTDEEDMGMSYDDLRTYAILRKEKRMGPVGMFEALVHMWGPDSDRNLTVQEVADKVKYFFRNYAINRHKLTTLTPSVHAENYSPDDNRFDLRPFLMSARWTFQFRRIDKLVARY